MPIRKRAVTDTVNPPGQIIWRDTLQDNIREFKEAQEQKFQCQKCGTVYYQQQQCDWCDGDVWHV